MARTAQQTNAGIRMIAAMSFQPFALRAFPFVLGLSVFLPSATNCPSTQK